MDISPSITILVGIIFLFIAYYLSQGPKQTELRNQNTKLQDTILELKSQITQLETENSQLKEENLDLKEKLTKKKRPNGGGQGFQDPHIVDLLKKI